MAWAKYGAECGLTLEQIQDELLNGRDLSKKRAAVSASLNMPSARPARPSSSSDDRASRGSDFLSVVDSNCHPS